MSINDRKTRMKLNIKRHRQKCLLKPKINPETSVTVIKKLSEQLIEEFKYYDSSDDRGILDSDSDNVSVGTEDLNEGFQIHNESDLDEDDEIHLKTTVTFDGPLVNDEINKTCLDNNYNGGTPVLDVNEPKTRMSRRTRKNINYFEKLREIPQSKTKKLSMKRKEKKMGGKSQRNAKVKKSRDDISKLFDVLKNICSSFNTTTTRVPKNNVLLYAKNECINLKSIEELMCREKKLHQEKNELLQKRLDEIILKS